MIRIHRNAVVLGGLGFIGSNLTLHLAEQGWNVLAVDIDHSSVESRARLRDLVNVADVREAQIRDVDNFGSALARADVVFDVAGSTGHLASMVSPETDLMANLVDHIHYLQVLQEIASDVPVISASTRQVMGKAVSGVVDDASASAPIDVNGVSKLAWEQYLRVMGSAWGLRSVSIRLPNVYGPRMRIRDSEHGVIGAWIGEALRGDPVAIFGPAAGQRRNVLHVTDAVAALVKAVPLATEASDAYLVGGEVRSLKEVGQAIGNQASVAVESAPMPDELATIQVGSLVVNDVRFREAASWAPSFGFEDGLRATIEFFREFGNQYA